MRHRPVPQCHAESLEARDVPGQLEYPQYPHDAEYLRYSPHLELAESIAGVSRGAHD